MFHRARQAAESTRRGSFGHTSGGQGHRTPPKLSSGHKSGPDVRLVFHKCASTLNPFAWTPVFIWSLPAVQATFVCSDVVPAASHGWLGVPRLVHTELLLQRLPGGGGDSHQETGTARTREVPCCPSPTHAPTQERPASLITCYSSSRLFKPEETLNQVTGTAWTREVACCPSLTQARPLSLITCYIYHLVFWNQRRFATRWPAPPGLERLRDVYHLTHLRPLSLITCFRSSRLLKQEETLNLWDSTAQTRDVACRPSETQDMPLSFLPFI